MSSEKTKKDLKELSLAELTSLVEAMGEKGFRAKQLYTWLYAKRALSLDDMTDVSKSFRAILKDEGFFISSFDSKKILTSKDGTVKYLIEFSDGLTAECVLIPEEERLTLCISTQCGCALACAFCLTGKTGPGRNLTQAEIIGEVIAAEKIVEAGKVKGHERVTNIVLMGMGEPLNNYKTVVRFLKILTDPSGMAYGPRKVTLSTAGIVPAIDNLGKDTNVNIAISLNATTDDVRDRIMPINKKYPLKELIAALKRYPLKPRRRFTIEYVLLGGVNDTPDDARRLCKLLKDIPSKINLIAFNPFPGSEFERPSERSVFAFQKILLDAGFTAVKRSSRGADILAACGQLKAQGAA